MARTKLEARIIMTLRWHKCFKHGKDLAKASMANRISSILGKVCIKVVTSKGHFMRHCKASNMGHIFALQNGNRREQ